jgi:hypothetical protein
VAALTPDDFSEAARRHFEPLSDQGFVAASVEGYRLAWTSGELAIEVLYDERDRQVLTVVDGFVGERNPRAGLSCLYVESGLGPAQKIHSVARSQRLLERALASQAEALQELLPILTGPRGHALLLSCHGR